MTDHQRESGSADNGFPERLATVIGRASVRSFARKTGVSDTFLRQCLAGRTDPTRSKLISIARAGNTSLEWLATGRGSATSVAANNSGVDAARLEAIIGRVEAVIAEDHCHLCAFQKARLIHALYEYYPTTASADTVRATLRKLLAAAN